MAVRARYTVIDKEVAEESRGVTLRDYVVDANGSTVVLVDSSQSVSDTFGYWPYGEVAAHTGVSQTPFRFHGVTQFYFVSATLSYGSWYQQSTGRWLTNTGDYGPSSYQYARGNPQSSWSKQKPHRLPWRGAYNAGTFLFEYGSYCGSANVKNPGFAVLPQDCIDACCQIHDRCLEAHQGAGFGNLHAHLCCDDALRQCVEDGLKSKCCYNKRPTTKLRAKACEDAAEWVLFGFKRMSAGARLTGPFYYYLENQCLPPDQTSKRFQEYVRRWWGKPDCPQPMGMPGVLGGGGGGW